MNLTLQKCESYLFDSHIFSMQSSLKDLYLNAEDLQPTKESALLQKYKIMDGKLVHKGTANTEFMKHIDEAFFDTQRYFVVELDIDPFTRKKGSFEYLIDLEANFDVWENAILVKKDPQSKQYSIEQSSKKSNFLTSTYLKRFAALFPEFLVQEGVEAVFPIVG